MIHDAVLLLRNDNFLFTLTIILYAYRINMAKVILLSPPYVDLYGGLNRAAGRYFPLGLGYIAAYLRRYGDHDVQMYEPEAQGLTYNDLAEIIKKAQPDVVGLTCSTPNFSRAIKLANIVRINSKARIIMGGVHASAIPEFIIRNYFNVIDSIVVGEGERTMLELVNAYQNKTNLETIKGIAYRQDGKDYFNESRPFIENLDTIPFPARDLISQKLFTPNMHNARYRTSLSMLTSRGCPFNCSFCASRIVSGKRYRTHSAEYVLEEMQMLEKDYHAEQLIITDDTFTIDNDRLVRICEGMIDKRLYLKWFCFSQINVVDKEILRLMRRAGCYNIGFGVESANESVLKRMGKPIRTKKVLETVKVANKVGLKAQAFYILGSYNETKKQMEDTIRFAKKVNATLAFFNMLVPYPGTREFQHFFATIPLNEIEWDNFVAVGEHCVLKSSDVSSGEIERLLARANIEYYTNPIRIVHLLYHIRTLYELFNYLKAGASLLRQIGKWSNRRGYVGNNEKDK